MNIFDIKKIYEDFCLEKQIPYTYEQNKILSYDDTTLFCPAGMQKFKPLFKDPSIKKKQ